MPLAGKVIVLDAGHQLGNHNFPEEINRLVPAGGFSKPCNTTGTATNGGYAEATFAWNVTMKLKAKLEKSGATVVLTRTSNREDRWGPCVDYRGRAGNTLRSGGNADLKISIHGDGSLASGAHGFHVIYPPDRAPWTDDIFKPSKRLALVTKNALVEQGVLGRHLHRRRRRPGRALRPRHPQPLRRPGRDAGGGQHARQRRRGGHDVRQGSGALRAGAGGRGPRLPRLSNDFATVSVVAVVDSTPAGSGGDGAAALVPPTSEDRPPSSLGGMVADGAWADRNTHHWDDWSLESLLAAKAGRVVSLVVPARNEAATVGDVVTRVREALVDTVALLDEIVVIDSDSTDATYDVATDAGAVVHRAAEIRPDLGWVPGKGEAMWKSQFVTQGEVIVFMDADLLDWDTHFVPGLLGPLLTRPEVQLVKGFYERPMVQGQTVLPFEGGRVTELVARPLIRLLFPELGGLHQPLAGEWAIRRSLFETLHVPTGYAVELAALVDTVRAHGLDALAQVDLGTRAHRHQSLRDLSGMSTQILAAALARVGVPTAVAADQERPPAVEA